MEDEILFAKEKEKRKEGGEGREREREKTGQVTCKARPIPVHRMQVAPEAVGDLLAVWDFLKVGGVYFVIASVWHFF